MRKQSGLTVILTMAGLTIIGPGYVHAQESGLKVGIARPAEGETLYTNPAAPLVSASVTGWVAVDGLDVTQLQVRLEIFQGEKSFGSLTTTPLADGNYSFDVAINPSRPGTLTSAEYGCKGNCHARTSLGFPSGAVRVRVTATDPLGRTATAQRSVLVDHSGYADVPVRVVVADNPQQTIEGLTIVGATRLYQWRARRYTARTDAEGSALLHVEALGQAPTRYTFALEPHVIDGVLYQSRQPVAVTLAPGGATAGPVTLIAESQRGQIAGSVTIGNSGLQTPWTVQAIELSKGTVYVAKTTQGRFTLMDLPLSKYLLAVDDEAAGRGWQVTPRVLDLSASPTASATLVLSTAAAHTARGVAHDSGGSPLPFAWVAAGEKGKTVRVSPTSGEFALHGLPADARTLWVAAPGYWSRPVALGADRLDITLTPQPDTRFVSWGEGVITLPSQTIATPTGNHLSLKRGWVWGKGDGPFFIATPELAIMLQTGAFALEYMPGETAWLYVLDGEAQVALLDRDESIMLGTRQMLAFGKGVPRPSAVALDDVVVRALHAGEANPLPVETEPAVPARLRDLLERLGIPTAQVVTFAAYLVVILAVMGALLGRRWWLRAQ